MPDALTVIEQRDIFALCAHRGGFAQVRKAEIGQVGVPFQEKLPCALSLARVGHLGRMGASIDGFDVAQIIWIATDRDGNAVVMRNVRKFLTGPENQKINLPRMAMATAVPADA